MSTPIRIKRSSEPGKRPTTNQLQSGELALNIFDGKLFFKQDQGTVGVGTRIVEIGGSSYVGKTVFVTSGGSDNNTGLSDGDAKATIKAAAAIALPGDTIKVYPGVYLEDNPIILARSVSIEGAELRNCTISPKNLDRDLFYVNNGTHITDLSFVSSEQMQNNSAVITFEPLSGISSDRFFDAARLIRLNLDFIASETVGYITPKIGLGVTFNFHDGVKKVLKATCFDITRGGNSKSVNVALSVYNESVGIEGDIIDAFTFAAGIAHSCVNNISWDGNYQSDFYQVKDLSIQNDPDINSNQDIASCANVISAIYSCVGVVTSIIENGPSILISGPGKITTTYPGNSGIGFTEMFSIDYASYDYLVGRLSVSAPGTNFRSGDVIELMDLNFEHDFGSGNVVSQIIPFDRYGNQYIVERGGQDSFEINIGISSIPYNYISGGIIIDRSIKIDFATYDYITGDLVITAPNAFVRVGDYVGVRDLQFMTLGNSVIIPNEEMGHTFEVLEVIETGNIFRINIGSSEDPHYYENDGRVYPPYGKGVGPITQGPYIRNCTNFIPKSIGMKVDGFNAEPGDKHDIGVTGAMSVDSYTQYNQGGIGASITNGAYCQLVSIFTICNNISVFTSDGGQCDITNSNTSFGTFGLVSTQPGDENSKSIYRLTANTLGDFSTATNNIVVSGVGNYRPYDGQLCYFGTLYKFVDEIEISNGGYGYNSPPRVRIDAPTGPNGITAQARSVIDSFGRVTAIEIVSSGSQYDVIPDVIIDPPTGPGIGASAFVSKMQPIYYKVDSATLPVSGISTITLLQELNNTVSSGTTVYFSRGSLQIASSHSFEWVGSGNNIDIAKPALGGVVIPENEVIQDDGGIVVYTSTDQAGNFKIGDGVVINQATGQIGGRDFTKSLFVTITPFVLALSE